MMKGTITLSVPKTATESDIKALRQEYSEQGYIVNIVKSGYTDNKEWLSEFLNARLRA